MTTFIRQRTVSRIAVAAAIVAGTLAVDRTPVQAQQPHGRALYDKHCAECHGAEGKGDGPGAAYLAPGPRDFASGKYKIRSTETGTVPTDDDLIQSVRVGLYGTAMPGWDGILSDADIRDVVGYIKGLSPAFATPPKVVRALAPVPSSPESIGRGRTGLRQA